MSKKSSPESGSLLSRLDDFRLDQGWTLRETCDQIERVTKVRVDPSTLSRAIPRGRCTPIVARAIRNFLDVQPKRKRHGASV